MELTKDVLKNWWIQTTGEAHYKTALDGRTNVDSLDKLRKLIYELVQDGVIAHAHNKKDGYYRLVEKAEGEIIWWEGDDIDDSKVNLILPFGLHKAVYIPRPALVTISGDTNAGKTAIADNILNYNQEKFDDIQILMCEGMDLFRGKMMIAQPKCPIPPKFHTFKRKKNFEDVIYPNGLNIIDYLRPPNSESLMSIGTPLEAIAAKLDTGIAVVCMQKPRGERGDAFGGIVTQWDAALSMSIHSTSEQYVSYLKLNKIKKALIFDRDLYKLKIRFKIDFGIKLTEIEKIYE